MNARSEDPRTATETPATPGGRRVRPPRAGLSCLLGAALLAGCATYPERTRQAFGDFSRGHFGPAVTAFADSDQVGSAFLSGAEAGTAALTAGDWEGALEHYHRAAAAASHVEGRALAGSEELGETISSWAINDTARAYYGEGFERVYVHCGLAMAYLAQGRLDDVFVEVRLANRLLEAEETLYDSEYRAGGWGHLISALTYEILGELDQAYVDYERMEEKGLGTEIAGPALVRLANRLDRQEDLDRWVEAYGAEAPGMGPAEADAANIVVLAGVGIGPHKVESRLALGTRDGLFAMAGAEFEGRPQSVAGLRLGVGETRVDTVIVEDVVQVAQENLSDRQAWLVAKSAVRGVLKRELSQRAEEEYGLGGRIAGDLFTFLTERADLRSWRTLPDTWQAARLFVPPGAHRLTLDAIGGDSVDLGSFELEPGETMLVFARSLGARLFAHPIGGRPLEDLQ